MWLCCLCWEYDKVLNDKGTDSIKNNCEWNHLEYDKVLNDKGTDSVK